MEGPLSARLQDARVNEALQVVAERRGRQSDVSLDGPRRCAFRPRLHSEPKDREAHRVPQCAQLLRVMIQLRRHTILLTLPKYPVKPFKAQPTAVGP